MHTSSTEIEQPPTTTYSQTRAKQLLDESQKIGNMFNINNFYDNNHLNVLKLKQKIIQAKRKLLFEKQSKRNNSSNQQKYLSHNRVQAREYKNNNHSQLSRQNKQQISHKQFKQKQKQRQQQQQKQKRNIKINQQPQTKNQNQKNLSLLQTDQQINQYKNIIFNIHNKNRKKTVNTQHRSQYKSKTYKMQKNNNYHIYNHKATRLATDLGDYQLNRKKSFSSYSRMSAIGELGGNFKNRVNGNANSRKNNLVTVQTPIQNSRSILQFQIQQTKIVIGQPQLFKQYQNKISVLWQLYQIIVQLMQQTSKSQQINQKLVSSYIKLVNSKKFQFVHEISQLFSQSRFQRTVRLSRILQNLSIFQATLNSIPKKHTNPTQIINYLGYSSSSVIFLIKLLLLTHQSSFTFSEKINSIIESIIKFQINSYKMQLKNIKQVLRRLQHNNQIIGMIKNRSGKKHGKYCQEFISKMIKNIQRYRTPFYQCANNIFQFLAFYLHHEELAGYLSLLSTPPSPFLSLVYEKTIIIDPWCVLANRKNNKLVIRAHAGKFLAQISDSCNIIFWTQFMPKDVDILTNLFPVKDNVYWLYRYHCRQENQKFIKLVDLVGCNIQNTIIIDSFTQHFLYNEDIGIAMFWKGEKKDTKLLNLSQIIQHIFAQTIKNKTSLKTQLNKMRPQLDQLNGMKKMYISKSIKYRSK